MIKNFITKVLKHFFFKYYIIILSKLNYAGGGLTKIPSNPLATISDLFLWRKDKTWTSFFELLNISHLINPNDLITSQAIAKLVFFDNVGNQIFEKDIAYSNIDRITINISNILPDSINGYGTFACFHLYSNSFLNDSKSFIAERGYCGYSRNNNICKSYVHGNLDALAYDKTNIEMLGNYNKRTYFYNLQYEFQPLFNYEIVLTNPTNKNQDFTLTFVNNHSLDEEFNIKPRGSVIKKIYFEQNINVKLIVKSSIYMARPVIFRHHHDSLDVFHG